MPITIITFHKKNSINLIVILVCGILKLLYFICIKINEIKNTNGAISLT